MKLGKDVEFTTEYFGYGNYNSPHVSFNKNLPDIRITFHNFKHNPEKLMELPYIPKQGELIVYRDKFYKGPYVIYDINNKQTQKKPGFDINSYRIGPLTEFGKEFDTVLGINTNNNLPLIATYQQIPLKKFNPSQLLLAPPLENTIIEKFSGNSKINLFFLILLVLLVILTIKSVII